MHTYRRPLFHILRQRLAHPCQFIQVLMGPRQCGKTTMALQLEEVLAFPVHYAAADEPVTKGGIWIEQQWETVELLARQHAKPALLIIDEIQKIPNWSETVKACWDKARRKQKPLNLLLLGSSTLHMQKGLTESLAGRFEILQASHWSYPEMRDAFGFSLDEYIYHGGYPGVANIRDDSHRWSQYILHSLIETTISRDILQMTRIDKPALLHRLFELGCTYSGQILSYQKVLGQLHDAGNTTTLAHYLKLLEAAGMLAGLQKYAGQKVRRRGSSPKFIAMNPALFTVIQKLDFQEARKNHALWGRMTETAVTSSVLNQALSHDIDVYYWLDRNHEVDIVLQYKGKLTAIEIKSSRKRANLPGLAQFAKQFDVNHQLLVGAQGISIEDFLSRPLIEWIL